MNDKIIFHAIWDNKQLVCKIRKAHIVGMQEFLCSDGEKVYNEQEERKRINKEKFENSFNNRLKPDSKEQKEINDFIDKLNYEPKENKYKILKLFKIEKIKSLFLKNNFKNLLLNDIKKDDFLNDLNFMNETVKKLSLIKVYKIHKENQLEYFYVDFKNIKFNRIFFPTKFPNYQLIYIKKYKRKYYKIFKLLEKICN